MILPPIWLLYVLSTKWSKKQYKVLRGLRVKRQIKNIFIDLSKNDCTNDARKRCTEALVYIRFLQNNKFQSVKYFDEKRDNKSA